MAKKLLLMSGLVIFLFAVDAQAQIPRPCGIYTLDSKVGIYRDANIRHYPFVTGYVLRTTWGDLENAKGVYNFSIIDHIIGKLEPLGKKMSLALFGPDPEPTYLANTPGMTTWIDGDMNPRRGGTSIKRPVPWNPYAMERFQTFAKALGEHRVPNTAASGALTPLRDHPVLANISLGIPGLGSIREGGIGGTKRPEERIVNLPGYTRKKFIDAIVTSLRTATDNFPKKIVYIGFWRVTDDTKSPELWEDIRTTILKEFDGEKNSKVGLFQENLAASKDPTTGAVTGYPHPEFAAPLYLSKGSTFILFQALTSWNRPFIGHQKVYNATPHDGIKYAYETYGATYFELYTPDLDDSRYWPSLQEWHCVLCK